MPFLGGQALMATVEKSHRFTMMDWQNLKHLLNLSPFYLCICWIQLSSSVRSEKSLSASSARATNYLAIA